ncbi:DUF1127 domain-containing protein [Pseudomonas sp. dw_358]|uniref:DUF1127 domain-containing protein n=1 Tax=Pseudomonas sp. dw_358 TaxID=2720083 RepID=UPI002117132C|nr:DUF1127 domain-containing protein [Pseudomonas sp. dw_358]
MKGQKGYALIRREGDVAGTLRRSLGHVLRWYELARQRRELAKLTESDLKDIGLSRADILEESERPFWDDPLRK